MSIHLALPHRSHHITQKVKIAGQHTFYLRVHEEETPNEIFLRQNAGPLIKSPAQDLPQETQHEESAAKEEDL